MLDPKDRIREEVRKDKQGKNFKWYVYLCKGCDRERWIRGGNEPQSSEFCLSCSYKHRVKYNKNKDDVQDNNSLFLERKVCPSCEISQTLLNFEARCGTPTNKCVRCRRLKKYNMTLRDYNNILESQNGVCAICCKPETTMDNRSEFIRNLAVDHCHKTGVVLGLLCGACNTSIGKFGEDDIILKRALNYVRKYKTKNENK